MRRLVCLAIAAAAVSGCYRTTYVNLQPPPRDPAATTTRSPQSGWQHYFLYGTLPYERAYPADQVCGAGNEVREISTRVTFAQGLVAILASYYVNIYAPYDLQIVCAPRPAQTHDDEP